MAIANDTRRVMVMTNASKLKLKTFIGNLDGVREGLVRAESKAQALAVVNIFMRCSRGDFNDYWYETRGFEDKLENMLYVRHLNRGDRVKDFVTIEEWRAQKQKRRWEE